MKTAVIGGGSWGSAFAIHLGRQNIPTRIWIREKDVFEKTRKYRENKTFLPGRVSAFASADFKKSNHRQFDKRD